MAERAIPLKRSLRQKRDASPALADKLASEAAPTGSVDLGCGSFDAAPGIWYMGSKRRLLDHFLGPAIRQAGRADAPLFDLFSGSAAVSRHFAGERPVWANDAQAYSEAMGRAYLLPDAASLDFLETLDPARQIMPRFRKNRAALVRLLGPALAIERSALAGELAMADYADFVETTPAPGSAADAVAQASAFESAADIFSEAALKERYGAPLTFPHTLMTAYYAHVYLGLEQAIEADSLSYAIRHVTCPVARDLYLGALILAVSVSTSGTSHFAQPTDIRKPAEYSRVLQRRRGSILKRFLQSLSTLRLEALSRPTMRGHKVFRGNVAAAFDRAEALEERPSVVYADPPYTQDNYSRFYHALEELVLYRYPPLAQSTQGLSKGRYASLDLRFQSAFCLPRLVEGAWREVIDRSFRLGAALVASYSDPSGHLLEVYRDRGDTPDEAIERFLDLFREKFSKVLCLRERLSHSGQGDKTRTVDEILVVARN